VAGAEEERLAQDARRKRNWKRWGPYLSERQWGTVREDYSSGGDCWNYSPMITPEAGPIAGAKMAFSASPIGRDGCALRWRCGTDATRF